MNAVGIIFSNIRDKHVPELTNNRIMASVPFGGRYRLIDFVLSNMTNSGIINAGVLSKHNYQNLVDHLGTGKAWDLARKRGGIRILQPYYDENSGYITMENRIETLKGIMYYIDKVDEDYVIFSDCDVVCNISYSDLLEQHRQSGADITVLYTNQKEEKNWNGHRTVLTFGQDGELAKMKKSQKTEEGAALYLGTLVMHKDCFKKHIQRAADKGYKRLMDYWADHNDDIIIKGYEFNQYHAYIDSLESYLNSNLELLDLSVREELFRKPYRPIYTSVNDSPPTTYGEDAEVENSIIADGCIIDGEVKNSIIFRGVKIEKGAKVNNCVIMQDSMIGKHATLNQIVTDKNVVIGDHRTLWGHETHPFFIGKGSVI